MANGFQSIRAWFVLLVAASAASTIVAGPACAQMQLPGAFNPAPAGTVAAPGQAGPRKPAHKAAPTVPKVPSDDGVIGHTLMQNGKSGLLEFNRSGKDLQVSRLKLVGEQISRVGDRCEVDLSSAPIPLSPAEKPAGLTRYKLELPACSFFVDMLDGAVRARRDGGACEFAAADCRIDPTGLWGQPASEIGAKRGKEIEHARQRAELTMRENFKAWIRSAGKDRALVVRIAHEQAAFSSRREELCRSYARESEHGYCALLTTEARSAAIAAHILPPEAPVEDRPPPAPKKPKRR